jgi:hypothetical protein
VKTVSVLEIPMKFSVDELKDIRQSWNQDINYPFEAEQYSLLCSDFLTPREKEDLCLSYPGGANPIAKWGLRHLSDVGLLILVKDYFCHFLNEDEEKEAVQLLADNPSWGVYEFNALITSGKLSLDWKLLRTSRFITSLDFSTLTPSQFDALHEVNDLLEVSQDKNLMIKEEIQTYLHDKVLKEYPELAGLPRNWAYSLVRNG